MGFFKAGSQTADGVSGFKYGHLFPACARS